MYVIKETTQRKKENREKIVRNLTYYNDNLSINLRNLK